MENDWKNSNHQNQGLIIKHILENIQDNKPLYIAATVSKSFYKDFTKNMYLTGLAFKYSKEKMDNIAYIRKNYEKNYLLDYLHINLTNDMGEDIVNKWNISYLPGFVKLYRHYIITGEKQKAVELKALCLQIAEKVSSGWYEYIKKATEED